MRRSALQGESRVADAQRRTREGQSNVARCARRRRGRRVRRPGRHHRRRQSGIGKVEDGQRSDQALRCVGAHLQARRHRCACVLVVRRNGSTMARKDAGRFGSQGRMVGTAVQMSSAVLKQTGIDPTRAQRQQPRHQNRNDGAALGASVRGGRHRSSIQVKQTLLRYCVSRLTIVNRTLGRSEQTRYRAREPDALDAPADEGSASCPKEF